MGDARQSSLPAPGGRGLRCDRPSAGNALPEHREVEKLRLLGVSKRIDVSPDLVRTRNWPNEVRVRPASQVASDRTLRIHFFHEHPLSISSTDGGAELVFSNAQIVPAFTCIDE